MKGNECIVAKAFRKCVLLLVTTCTFLFANGITVDAATSHTKAEALSWLGSLTEAKDYDGSVGIQCVDLIYEYYRYLGQKSPGGNAVDYANNKLPDGWTRVYSDYQPGDIAVYKAQKTYYTLSDGRSWWIDSSGGGNGHVSIITGVIGNNFVCVEQHAYQKQIYRGTIGVPESEQPMSALICAIRPFGSNNAPQPTEMIDNSISTSSSNVTSSDAKISASFKNGSRTISSHGFVIGKKSDLSDGKKVTSGGGTAIGVGFILSEKGITLSADTTYYYQIFIVENGITKKSVIKSFRTAEDVSSILKDIVVTFEDGAYFKLHSKLKSTTGSASLQYAVWTGYNGQDDLKWYSKIKSADSNGEYVSQIKYSEHNNEMTGYIVHIYTFDNSGNATFRKEIVFNPYKLSKAAITLNAGSSINLTISPAATSVIKWESSNANAVTVDKNGKVTGIAPSSNKVTITGTFTVEGISYKVYSYVTVVAPLKNISLSATKISLEKGKSRSLSVIFNPENTSDSKKVTWLSSNTKVATVDKNGKVTAVGKGTATITATSAVSGVKAVSCSVTVTTPSPAYTKGDPNNDGAVNRADKIFLSRYLAKWPGYTINNLLTVDFNNDGKVNRADKIYLARYLSRWPGYTLNY